MTMKRLWLTVFYGFNDVNYLPGRGKERRSLCRLQAVRHEPETARSRMEVSCKDGSTGSCSINFVVVEQKANQGSEVKLFQVGDYGTGCQMGYC